MDQKSIEANHNFLINFIKNKSSKNDYLHNFQEATLSGEGPYIISTRDDMDSSSSLMRAEIERGSVMKSRPDSVPRDSSKIFKVIDKAQVFCTAH